jgi:hypothetical protein
MPEMDNTTSANGAWDLRHRTRFVMNEAGYGNGSWDYQLVDRATGRVVRTWSGSATVSPWSEASLGTRSVTWDGDVLVVVEEGGTEERIAPEAVA